jgi:hypothetical protein
MKILQMKWGQLARVGKRQFRALIWRYPKSPEVWHT